MINFAGKLLPSFVKVISIQHSILPSITHNTATVLGRAGAYDFGVELGMRKISVDIQIIADNQNDIMSKATQLASWLFYEDLQVLIVGDEPDKQYMARISGETELSEIYRVGQGTLEFVCPDAYKDSTVEKELNSFSLEENNMIQAYNAGSAKTYPVVELTLREDSSALSLASDEDFILLGESAVDKEVIDDNPLLLHDALTSTSGWTTGINSDNGTNTGTLYSTGNSLAVTNKDYGEGSSWHGASSIKALPTQLQDFEVEGRFAFRATSASQVGRAEIYFLDANNVSIGKMAMVDKSSAAYHPKIEGRAGTWRGGHYFALSHGSKIGVWSKVSPGVIKVSRKGNVWNFFMGEKLSNGKFVNTYEKQWIDTKNEFDNKLAKVMIHIGTYGDKQPVNTMYFSDLKIWDRGIDVDSETQIGTPFKQGDIVTIDNRKAEILLNGEPAYDLLNPSSSFFPLEVGNNAVILSPPIADVNIKYRERWL